METNSNGDLRRLVMQATCLASVVVAAGCVFWPALSFDFVSWGDPLHVSAAGLVPADIVGQERTTFAPVVDASLAVDRFLWGSHSTGFHLTSVLLHLVNTGLVFLLVRRISDDTLIAWLTALIFAVHPVQVETVAWIAARGTLIGTTAALGSMLLWFREGRGPVFASVVLLAVALLANVSLIALPFVMLAFRVLVQQEPVSAALRGMRVHFAVAVSTCGLVILQSSAATALIGSSHLSVPHLVAMKLTSLWTYVGMLVTPKDLCIAYAPTTESTSVVVSFCAALIGLVAAILCAIKLRQVRPGVVFAVTAFGLLLGPAVVFGNLQSSLLSDQFLYLPCMAFAGVVAAAVAWFGQLVERAVGRWPARATCVLATAGLTGVLAIAAGNYLPVWSSSATLWSHAASQLPDAVEVRVQQANALRYQGRETDALVALQDALKQFPRGTAARDQVDSLLKDWLMESTEATMKRRQQSTLM